MISVLSRRKPLTRAALVSIAVTSLLVTSACSADQPTATDGGNSAKLSIAVAAQPASLDPSQLAEGQQAYIWASIFDTLLVIDKAGKIQPNAAKSWEYSDNLHTLTLKLRNDLKFSNGDAVKANDVRATLERTRTTPGQQQSKLANVASIGAPDDSTVVIKLSTPEPSLLNYLAQATGVIGDADHLGDKSGALRPIGSGPYTLSDETVDGTTYVLQRRDDYWNAGAYPFKTFTVRVIQDQTATFNALQAGEINAGIIQAPQRPQAEAAKLTIKPVDATATLLLVLADREGKLAPALADLRVRQAINMAFNREQLVKTLLSDVGRPTVQVFNPHGEAYNKDLEGKYKFDPEGARRLLAEAGYKDGFSLTMPSTVISKSFEPVITQALADIGIKVSWEPVPPQNTAASVASKKYPAVLWFAGLNSAGREVGDMYTPTAFLNPFGWRSPDFDQLLQKVANEPGDEARANDYKEISKFTVDRALNAPIAYVGTLWATTSGIEYLPEVNLVPTIRDFGIKKS